MRTSDSSESSRANAGSALIQRRQFPETGCALVVGGSGGIGSAICHGLSEAGSKVALTFGKNRNRGDSVANDVGGQCFPMPFDEPSSVEDMVAVINDRCGPIHSLVFAVGADIQMRYVSEVRIEQWHAVMQSDAGGFFRVVRAALPHLRATAGSITAITTSGLDRFPPRDILSVAPKAAIDTLVTAIAREEGRYGVRANSVRVAVVEAGMFLRLKEELGESWMEAARKKTPLRRFAAAHEIADAVVFLASARASYITGQSLAVDGGYAT